MQVKVYTGNSTTAVLAGIKAELGPDAVILDTRETIEDGRTLVRITAAVDALPDSAGSGGPGNGGRNGTVNTGGNGNGTRVRAASPTRSTRSEHSGIASSPLFSGSYGNGGSGGGAGPDGPMPPGWKFWHEEWNTIKQHLLALMKPELQLEKLSPRQRLAVEFLEREGLDETMVLALYKKLLPLPGASILDPLAELVPVRAWGAATWPQPLHLIAGPYGAGKTTAAVRLALALRKSAPNLRIALLNADAERGGGRLVLRNYAELSEFEYRETGSRLETAAALADLDQLGMDRIIVDLPGLSRGKTLTAALEDYALARPDAALHLVLPPHLDPALYGALLERYAPGPTGPRDMSLIWSKLDEAEKFGALVNVGALSRLPVSALSFGPGLRNTLAAARDVMLWRLLFKKELPTGV